MRGAKSEVNPRQKPFSKEVRMTLNLNFVCWVVHSKSIYCCSWLNQSFRTISVLPLSPNMCPVDLQR